MWSVLIIIISPSVDNFSGMIVAAEKMFIQAFIPQSAIEAFNQAILHGFSRRYINARIRLFPAAMTEWHWM